ncbi:hypothetical protein LZ30DRAFT_694848 [Colletotrichum cereale]|nr:hypothetical protein LZ30DRAFT_694848 [Colletotrichum cereale]
MFQWVRDAKKGLGDYFDRWYRSEEVCDNSRSVLEITLPPHEDGHFRQWRAVGDRGYVRKEAIEPPCHVRDRLPDLDVLSLTRSGNPEGHGATGLKTKFRPGALDHAPEAGGLRGGCSSALVIGEESENGRALQQR